MGSPKLGIIVYNEKRNYLNIGILNNTHACISNYLSFSIGAHDDYYQSRELKEPYRVTHVPQNSKEGILNVSRIGTSPEMLLFNTEKKEE